MNIERFNDKIIGILRGYNVDDSIYAVTTAASVGVDIFEIALRGNELERDLMALKELRSSVGQEILVGAGTVLTAKDALDAIDFGADFLVSPVYVGEVNAICKKRKIPYMPGAFTPTEMYNAMSNGAFMVKLFPAGTLGAGYIKAIKAPFPDMPIVAMGGITPENISDYRRAGAKAYGISSGIFVKDNIVNRRDEAIKTLICNYNKGLIE